MPHSRFPSDFFSLSDPSKPHCDTYIMDNKGRYQYVDAPALAKDGYDADDMIGKHYTEVLRDVHLEIVAPYFEAALVSGHSSYFNFPVEGMAAMIGIFPFCGVYRKIHCVVINVSYVRAGALRDMAAMGIVLTPPRFPKDDGFLGG